MDQHQLVQGDSAISKGLRSTTTVGHQLTLTTIQKARLLQAMDSGDLRRFDIPPRPKKNAGRLYQRNG